MSDLPLRVGRGDSYCCSHWVVQRMRMCSLMVDIAPLWLLVVDSTWKEVVGMQEHIEQAWVEHSHRQDN